MSADSSDSEPCCEWTLVSGDGRIIEEDTNDHEELPPISGEQNEQVENGTSVTGLGEGENLEELLWSHGDVNCKTDFQDDSARSDSSSDIEKIEEPPSLDISFHSHESKLSDLVVTPPHIEDDDIESLPTTDNVSLTPEDQCDLSDNTSLRDELLAEMNLERVRSYRHTPNQRLNLTLNVLLVLTITAVVGLGVGHFIGWSNQWMYKNHIQQSQIQKLRVLQDELITCLQRQASGKVQTGPADFKTCSERVEHWRSQFDEFLGENEDMRELMLHETQGLSAAAAVVGSIGGDDHHHELKADLLHKHMELYETLKQFELIKLDERESRQKAEDLKEENEDLKIKLEAEVQEDAEEQRMMCHLMKENTKLRLALNDLQQQTEDGNSGPKDDIIQVEVGSLRQQMNKLQLENEDLRKVISRLRYGKPPEPKMSEEHQNKINQLEAENDDLKVEIGKIRYGKPPSTTVVSDDHIEAEVAGQQPHIDVRETVGSAVDVAKLQEEIEQLQNAVDLERNQTLMWKELYEKSKTLDSGNFESWLRDNILGLDVAKLFTMFKMNESSATGTSGDNPQEKSREWLEIFWSNVSHATGILLKKIEESKQQMEEFMATQESQVKPGRYVVKKMKKLLSNTMHKFKQATEVFFPKKVQESSRKTASKLADKLYNLVNNLNTKWSDMTRDFLTPSTFADNDGQEADDNSAASTLDNMADISNTDTISEMEEIADLPYDETESTRQHVDQELVETDDKTDDKSVKHNGKNDELEQNYYKNSESANDSVGKQSKYKPTEQGDTDIDDDGATCTSMWCTAFPDNGAYDEKQANDEFPNRDGNDWMFNRARERERQRYDKNKWRSDWLFDRARDREERRYPGYKHNTDWLFKRARDRDEKIGEFNDELDVTVEDDVDNLYTDFEDSPDYEDGRDDGSWYFKEQRHQERHQGIKKNFGAPPKYRHSKREDHVPRNSNAESHYTGGRKARKQYVKSSHQSEYTHSSEQCKNGNCKKITTETTQTSGPQGCNRKTKYTTQTFDAAEQQRHCEGRNCRRQYANGKRQEQHCEYDSSKPCLNEDNKFHDPYVLHRLDVLSGNC